MKGNFELEVVHLLTRCCGPPGIAVKVHFVAVGNAPIMKKQKFVIGGEQKFFAVRPSVPPCCLPSTSRQVAMQVAHFLRKQLRLQESSPLVWPCLRLCAGRLLIAVQFLYCNSAFSPSPEDSITGLATVHSAVPRIHAG